MKIFSSENISIIIYNY